MKRGQLAAVILIVILVAVVAGILLFSNKRAGMAIGAGGPASYLPATCADTTVTVDSPFCRSPQWQQAFQGVLNTKCGVTLTQGQRTGPNSQIKTPNCKATLESFTNKGCIYNIDCK